MAPFPPKSKDFGGKENQQDIPSFGVSAQPNGLLATGSCFISRPVLTPYETQHVVESSLELLRSLKTG